MWKEAVGLFRNFMGAGMIVILFLLAVAYLLVNEKRKHVRVLFVYTPVALLLLYFNPLFARLLFEILGNEIYYRMLWLLPITPVIAYSAVCICGKAKESKGRGAAAVTALGMAAVIALSGSFIYSNPFFYRAENFERLKVMRERHGYKNEQKAYIFLNGKVLIEVHISDRVVHICDAIIVPGREVMAAFPPEFVQFVRQYSPLVCMPYGRDALVERWGIESEVYDLMTAEEIDLEALNRAVLEQGCHYVILHSGRRVKGSFEECGWELFCETDGYCVYRTEYPLVIPGGF